MFQFNLVDSMICHLRSFSIKEGRKIGFLLLAVISIAAVFLLSSCDRKVAATVGEEAVPVVVSTVRLQSVPVQIRVIGSVAPSQPVTVRPQITGKLEQLYFHPGEDVKQGDLLYTIDRRPFEEALAQAEGNLNRDEALLTQAQAQLERDAAQAEYSRVTADRNAELNQNGIVSRDSVEQTRAAATATGATVQADRAAVESARAQVVAQRAAVEYAKLQLEYCSIYSPEDGRASLAHVPTGNLATANETALVVINRIKPIHVSFSVPETFLPEIRKYMSGGQLKLQALIPNEKASEGTLGAFDNAVDSATGTIRLRGDFPNEDERLWPGEFVDVVLNLTSKPNAIVVPSQAVQTGQQGPFVFVVKPDKRAEPRPVELESGENGLSVISKGLRPGEQVVTDGQSRLTAGTKVQIKTETAQDGQNR